MFQYSLLRYTELCAIFKETDKKQHRFTVEKFFEFVNATKEERAWFYKATNKEKPNEKRKPRNMRKLENYAHKDYPLLR